MSDTPRHCPCGFTDDTKHHICPITFARIEREITTLRAERDSLQEWKDRAGLLSVKLSAMAYWLDANAPSVFRSGIWDAINAAQKEYIDTARNE